MIFRFCKIFILLLVICGYSKHSSPSHSSSHGDFGLGIVVGEPTGLCFKYGTSGTNALAGALAFGYNYIYHHHYYYYDYYEHETYMYLHINYQWYSFVAGPMVPLYVGVGGRLIAGEPFEIGPRLSGGIDIIPSSIPFDFFFELGLTLNLVEDTGVDIDAGVGARFFF